MCTLTLGALKGIICAVAVSLFLILYQVADPPISTLGWADAEETWLDIKCFKEARQRNGILVFRVEGPLFYANVEHIQEWLQEKEIDADAKGQPLKALVLSASALNLIDTTAVDALKQMVQDYQSRNIVFMVANASGQPQKILRHVLSDYLPAPSLNSCWCVQRCIQHIIGEEVQEESPAMQLQASPRSLDNSLSRPLNPFGHTSLPDIASMRSRYEPPKPLQRHSQWVSGGDLQKLAMRTSSSRAAADV